MSEPLTKLLLKIDSGDGVTAEEMSQLIWPLINVAKAASSLLAVLSKLSSEDLNKRDEKEIALLLVLRESINQLSRLETAPALDA